MNYSEIHAALKAKEWNWPICAKAIGCSTSHLMNVASRRAESKAVAKALSVLIEKEVSEVFPDIPRYQEDMRAKRESKLAEAKARLAEAGLAESA
jgi:hypothetical protein